VIFTDIAVAVFGFWPWDKL